MYIKKNGKLIPLLDELDISHLETKSDAIDKLTEAKSYTDEKTKDIGVLYEHIDNTDNPHKVTKTQVSLGNVENYGIATKIEAESGTATNKYMTPLRVAEHLKANGVQSVANIKKDENGNIPLTIGDLSTDNAILPDVPPREYPLGVTTFRGNVAQSNAWKELVGDGDANTRVLVVTFKAHNTWQATQTIYLIDGFGNTGNTIQHRAIYVRSTMASTQSTANKWSDPVKIIDERDIGTNKINVIEAQESDALITDFPTGISVFYTNTGDEGYPFKIVTVTTFKASTATAFQIAARNGYNEASKQIWYRIVHYQTGWSDWFEITDSRKFSNSTTSDSTETVATSKAVKYLNDALIETDDNLRSLRSQFYYSNNKVSNHSSALGEQNTSSGDSSTAFGGNNTASSLYSTAWGYNTLANETSSTAWGYGTKAEGTFATAFGRGTSAQQVASTAMGTYNKIQKVDDLLSIGNGTEAARTNALRLNDQGHLFISGKYNTTGADYAEYFEWEDGNPEKEDRVGLFVTWGNNGTVKLANHGDKIVGIVSSTAAILGDSHEDQWHNMYLTDQFGRTYTKEVEVEYKDIKGNTHRFTENQLILNPYYDPAEEYIPRSQRPEWSPIGLMGKLYVIDDGTCEVDGYAIVDKNGKATKGSQENGYRVLKRISKNVSGESGIVQIMLFK